MLTLLIVNSNQEHTGKVKEKIRALTSVQLTVELLHVPTLQEALQLLDEQRIDLIITDLRLHDAAGADIVEQLHEKNSSIPILLCGSKISDPTADSAIHAGAQDYFDIENMSIGLLARLIRYSIERQHLTESLRSLSFTDELTGAYNRRGFLTLVEQQKEIAERTGRGFFLYLMDVDYLKQINDTYGHQVGDQALVEIARLISISFRRYDIVGRIGGDEFAVLALTVDEEYEKEIRKKVTQHFEEYNKREHKPYTLSISIGSIYYHPTDELSFEELFALADKSLYHAKQERIRNSG